MRIFKDYDKKSIALGLFSAAKAVYHEAMMKVPQILILTCLSLCLSVMLSLADYSGQAYAADPFTVSNVAVDASAENAIEAQTMAAQEGQLRAAQILLERLTLETERLSKPLPPLSPEIVQPMIRAISVDNEKRSANRYLGDLSVAFNPREVQNFLRSNQLTMVSSQARPRLVVPVTTRGDDGRGSFTFALVKAFETGGFAHALTPISGIADIEPISPDADRLAAIGAQYGTNQVLIVEAVDDGDFYSAQFKDVIIDSGLSRALNSGSASSAPDLAGKIIAQLEQDWKVSAAGYSAAKTTSIVTMRYNGLRQWQALKDAINSSAQIKDARLDALSKDGAMMTLTYGNLDRLRSELQYKGVRLLQDPELGLVFEATQY